MPEVGEITELLQRLSREEGEARGEVLDQLVPLIYGELKMLARANRYRWQGTVVPSTTSLVHEAYAKIARQPGSGRYGERRQFFAVASKAMRSILIDNARWHQRKKRGGRARPVPIDEARLVSAERSAELIELDEALDRLEHDEPALARIVECRCFGGLTVDETAETLEISTATVKRRWALARAWLFRELDTAAPGAHAAT